MRNDYSVEGAIGGVVLALFILLSWVSFDSVKPVNVTINDNGCASHQPPSPGYKQRIETYNLESLKGNN